MNLLRGVKTFAFTAIVFTILACWTANLKAEWIKVQDHPVTLYRDSTTNMIWSVTLTNAGNNNAYARQVVSQYGLRLPTWNELRYVVNHQNAIMWLNMKTGFLDLYETQDPSVLAGAYGGSIDTKRPRQPIITQTWVIGVRDY